MRPRAGALGLQPWEAIEGWRDGRSGSMVANDEEPERPPRTVLLGGQATQTHRSAAWAVLTFVSLAQSRGQTRRTAWASRHKGCEPLHETVFCSRFLRRLASAPLGDQN